MIVGSVLFVHAVIGFFGARNYWRQQHKKLASLYVLLIGISAYGGIATPASLPPLSITDAISSIFKPAEEWIETLMGGPY